MGYAIFRLDKIGSAADLNARYNHNYREEKVKNADPSLAYLNREIISLNGLNYTDTMKNTIAEIKAIGAQNRAIRRDAVLGFEVMLTSSYNSLQESSVDKWAEKSTDWLIKTFNPQDNLIDFYDYRTGKRKEMTINNVKSVILHMDEETAHLHAFIVPIDNKGHLNAKYYTGGRSAMIELQNSYAKEMQEFGLERGEPNSVATPEEKKKFRNGLVKAVNASLPEPLPDDNLVTYKERAENVFQIEKIHHHNDVINLESKIKNLESKRITERSKYKSLTKAVGIDDMEDCTPERIQEIQSTYREANDLKKTIQFYPDQVMVNTTMQNIQQMLEWERNRRKREKNLQNILL